MLIWLVFAVVTAACLALAVLPLVRSGKARADREEFDVEVYRDQLEQLERDEKDGELSSADAEAARLEISRRILALSNDDPAKAENVTADDKRPMRRAAMAAVIVLAPAIAVSAYLTVGSPDLPGQPLRDRKEVAEQKDLSDLVKKVENHLQSNPQDGRGWKIIAPAYLQLKRYRDAANAFERAMALNGRDPATLTSFGEALMLAEDGLITERSRSAFLEAAKADRSQFKAIFYLGLAEQQGGKTQSAIALWKKLLEDGGKDAPWRPIVEAQLKQAEKSLSGAPALSKDELAAANDLSEDERHQMVEGMVSRLADRLEANGDDLDGWLRLARAYTVMGRRDSALDALRKATAHFAGNKTALKQIEQVKVSLNLAETKETASNDSATKDTTSQEPTNKDAARAPQLTKEDVEAVQSLGHDERQQMIETMVARLASRLEEDGSDLDGWLRLARSYTVLGRKDDARKALDKAAAQFTGNTQALNRIEQARTEFGLTASE